jgi:hypothetical protein
MINSSIYTAAKTRGCYRRLEKRIAGSSVLSRIGLLVAAVVAIAPLGAQSAQTGQLTGTIATQSGTPVAHAFVVSTSGANPGKSFNTRSAADGSFTLSGLPIGIHRICVQVLEGSLLDPCQWSSTPPSATISSNQVASLGAFQLIAGQRLYVKLIDDNASLAANQGRGKTPGAHVLIGVWSTGGLFHTLRFRNQNGKTLNYDLVVPLNTALTLTASSTAFALTDDKGNKINPSSGANVPILIASGSMPAPIVFHVTGLNGKGN